MFATSEHLVCSDSGTECSVVQQLCASAGLVHYYLCILILERTGLLFFPYSLPFVSAGMYSFVDRP